MSNHSNDRTDVNMMQISLDEFTQLQNQIVALRSEKYDLQQREKKLSSGM